MNTYAIVTNTSKDDGYGGRSPCIEYVGFLNRDEWEWEWEWEIAKLSRSGQQFRAFISKPVTVSFKVVVNE